MNKTIRTLNDFVVSDLVIEIKAGRDQEMVVREVNYTKKVVTCTWGENGKLKKQDFFPNEIEKMCGNAS